MLGWWVIYRASSWCCEPICSWGRNHLMRSERVSFFCVFSMLFFRWNCTFFWCQWKREMCLSATLVSCAKFADVRGKSQQQQIIIIIRFYKYACEIFLQDKTVAVFFFWLTHGKLCVFFPPQPKWYTPYSGWKTVRGLDSTTVAVGVGHDNGSVLEVSSSCSVCQLGFMVDI